MKWTKLKTRELTEEEKEFYPDFDFLWDCQTPDVDEEVLVSSGYTIWIDIWVDCGNGVNFRDCDAEGLYWMPLPKPPKLDRYKRGFQVHLPKNSMCDEEWIFDEKNSTEDKLIFQGYDANLCPMPDFGSWPDTPWKNKVIERALQFTKDFKGEVWLDDVRIKEVEK